MLMNLVELFPDNELNPMQKDYFKQIKKLTNFLVEEIRAQRDLLEVESSNFEAKFKLVNIEKFIKFLVNSIR